MGNYCCTFQYQLSGSGTSFFHYWCWYFYHFFFTIHKSSDIMFNYVSETEIIAPKVWLLNSSFLCLLKYAFPSPLYIVLLLKQLSGVQYCPSDNEITRCGWMERGRRSRSGTWHPPHSSSLPGCILAAAGWTEE